MVTILDIIKLKKDGFTIALLVTFIEGIKVKVCN